jgi:hypothetical protein
MDVDAASERTEPAERPERGPVVSLAERLRAPEERPTAESTRFALFRRLAPALRHDLVGELQGIRFAVDLAQRQLRQWTCEPAMEESLTRVASQAAQAQKSGDAILDWLRPDSAKKSTVRATVEECLALVRTDWSMRGIEVHVTVPSTDREVAGHALREVLAASLIALSDAMRTPADVDVIASDDGTRVELSIAARVAAREAFPPMAVARAFGWDDVQALARADGVDWSRQDLSISMRFPGAAALAA